MRRQTSLLFTLLGAVGLSCLTIGKSSAAVVISVVLDPTYSPTAGTPVPAAARGILVAPGALVNARFFAELTAPTSLATYSFTIEYDRNELNYVNGSRNETPGNLTGLSELDTTNGVNPTFSPTSGRLFAFDGGTFGTGPSAPLGPVQIGAASFTVGTPLGDLTGSDLDIRPGILATGVDGFFDNAFADLVAAGSVVFQSGSIAAIPEPSSLLLVALTGLVVSTRRRRR